MSSALLTGVSGLLAHQRWLDVVGHNIANMNAHGYKKSRVLFADMFYETLQPATGPSGNFGGTNPSQIGSGVRIAQVDRNFSQGTLEATGQPFDVAIEGDGFFVLSDGVTDSYTRTGAFTPDAQGMLVGPTGLKVQRFGTAGEASATNPGFQIPGDSQINIPIGASVPAIATTEMQVRGNLDADLNEALQEQQQTAPYTTGGVAAVGATLLNSLDNVIVAPYAPGDTITIGGLDSVGNNITVPPLNASAATTLQDLVTYIDGSIPDATASIVNGSIVVVANNTGPSMLNIQLNQPAGKMTFEPFVQTVVGADADTVADVVTVFDGQGGAHEIKLLFEKQADDVWNMTASMNPTEGTVTDDVVDNITFSDFGDLLGTGDPVLQLQINGIAAPQQVTLNLLLTGVRAIDELTHFSGNLNLNSSADGSPAGVIQRVEVNQDGLLQGFANNGRVFTVAQLAIASFANSKGLDAVADNLYQETLNSGTPNVGPGATGSRGQVRAGQLEASNVDLAYEFTRLIVAQRGFSANARTITVSDEVLEELTNIIR